MTGGQRSGPTKDSEVVFTEVTAKAERFLQARM